MKIILASTSPRRKELLTTLGISYYEVAPPFDEESATPPCNYSISEYFAKEKALSVVPLINNKYIDATIILGSDTIIRLDDTILGKPPSKIEAQRYLELLSGKTHIVETSIACYNRNTKTMKTSRTENFVTVKKLSSKNIDWYMSKNEWIDAAGAYKIQGNFQRFISSIKGTQSSVMGLPLFELCDILDSYGFDFS